METFSPGLGKGTNFFHYVVVETTKQTFFYGEVRDGISLVILSLVQSTHSYSFRVSSKLERMRLVVRFAKKRNRLAAA